MHDSWMLLLQDIVQTHALERIENCLCKVTRRSHISFHQTRRLLNHYTVADSAELIKLLVPNMKHYRRHRKRLVLDSDKA
jgi:predicted GNAT family acetyltransferase